MNITKKLASDKVKKLTGLIVSIFIGIVIFFVGYLYPGKWKYDNVKAFYLLMSGLFLALIIFNYVYSNFFKWKIHNIYLVNAAVFGIIMTMLIPVYAAPDEPSHMWTAYNLSNRILGEETVDHTEGVYMRADDAEEVLQHAGITNEYYDIYFSKFNDSLENKEMVQTTFRPLDTYSYQYIISSLGITLGRILNLGTMQTYLLGRVFNYLFFMLLIYFSIKLVPFGKSAFAVLAFFPMTLQQVFSFSYDSFIIPLAIFIIALTIYLCYGKDIKHKKILYGLLIIAVIALLPTKSKAYFPICAFALLGIFKKRRVIIDKVKVFKQKNKTLFYGCCGIVTIIAIASIVLATHIALGIVNNENMTVYIERLEQDGYTLGYWIKHPGSLMRIIANTFYSVGDFYLFSFIGNSLGWFEINIPYFLVLPFFIFMLLAGVKKEKEVLYLGRYTKIVMNLLALMCFACTCVGMLLEWTTVSDVAIAGVQGRYFIPFALLSVLTLRSNKIVINRGIDKIIFNVIPYLYMLIYTYIIVF